MARILLVNPPIYDFTAYDFWLKPYGLLTVGGWLRGMAELRLFDYLDRLSPLVPTGARLRRDRWGRGQFYAAPAPKPAVFAGLPRRWRRYGIPRQEFQGFLAREGSFDFALVGGTMTYWYGGVKEVIEDIRQAGPATKIVLGGLYASLCPVHARTLGADLIVEGHELEPLWNMLGLAPDTTQPPLWQAYPRLAAGVVKLTDGCPFRCTYCCVPLLWPEFSTRPTPGPVAELELLLARRAKNVAFYDDALLHQPSAALVPFLEHVLQRGLKVNFHTPNALHARLLTPALAGLMVRAGVRTSYLGFESASETWQQSTGAKVTADELDGAVQRLRQAGARPDSITAYTIVGHPDHERQQVEESMRLVHSLGVRIMLAEFSPIPSGTTRLPSRWPAWAGTRPNASSASAANSTPPCERPRRKLPFPSAAHAPGTTRDFPHFSLRS
jgi:hypothetical protein